MLTGHFLCLFGGVSGCAGYMLYGDYWIGGLGLKFSAKIKGIPEGMQEITDIF